MNALPVYIQTPPACETFSCGPLLPPAVQVVYASGSAARHDAAFREVVQGGYLDAAGMQRVAWHPPETLPLPPGYLSNASIRETVSTQPRGTLYVVVLGPEQATDLYGGKYAYHEESDDGRYAVLPARDEAGELVDFAHEVVEGLEDAEIADPCAYTMTRYGPWLLQTYSAGGVCTAGEYSRPREIK